MTTPDPLADAAAQPDANTPATTTPKTPRQLQVERMRDFQRQQLAPYTPRVYVTWLLIAINVAVWVVMVARGVSAVSPTTVDLLHWGGDYAPRTTHGDWWRVVSCTFVHAGLLHLAMNMLVLAIIGPFMERLLGNAGFLALYLFAGMTGSLLSLAYAPTVVSVGASGADFGLYGALVGFLLRARGTLPKDILQQLLRMAGAFVVYNFLFGLGKTGIDQAAHVGGLVGGFAGGVVLGHPLEAAAFATRARRVAVLVAVGVGLFALAVAKLPKPVDMQAEYESFAALEKRVLAVVNDAGTKARAGTLHEDAMLALLKKDVLPPWNAEMAHLRGLTGLAPRADKARNKLIEYMQKRGDGWQLTADGLEKHDPTLFDKATASQAEADALAKKVFE